MATKVGLIGAGNMGFGMSCNLLKAGYQVVVYDLRPEPLEALAARGATIAPDPGAVGRACGLVFSVVLDAGIGMGHGPAGGQEEHVTAGAGSDHGLGNLAAVSARGGKGHDGRHTTGGGSRQRFGETHLVGVAGDDHVLPLLHARTLGHGLHGPGHHLDEAGRPRNVVKVLDRPGHFFLLLRVV